MQLNDLQRNTKQASARRVGRGGKRGKTSGRGMKGQKARAGHRIRPALRDIIKKMPKRRGYRFASFKEDAAPVNLSALEAAFSANDTVSPETLAEKGILSKRGGTLPPVKILGDGELTKKLTVTGCAVSNTARQAIEASGGSVA